MFDKVDDSCVIWSVSRDATYAFGFKALGHEGLVFLTTQLTTFKDRVKKESLNHLVSM
jgi:hypothetical protein